jgi:hypothetical protein
VGKTYPVGDSQFPRSWPDTIALSAYPYTHTVLVLKGLFLDFRILGGEGMIKKKYNKMTDTLGSIPNPSL